MNRAKLKEELIRDEGYRRTAYEDSLGFWTIGVGHLLGTEERMIDITHDEIDALFDRDIDNAANIAFQLAPEVFNNFDDLNKDARERVLVNMAFNLGPKLAQFKKFLAAVNSHDWKNAAVYMMQSKWATQVGKRAERLRDMILNGDNNG